jgi:glycosyl hydrolase family 113
MKRAPREGDKPVPRPRFLAAAAAAVAAVLMLGAPSGATTSQHGPSAGRGYVPASAIADGGPIHGVILSDANKVFGANIGDLQRLVDDGVNLVNIYVTNYFTSVSDPRIVSGKETPTDQQISAVVAAAHAAGLAVEIDPILWSKGKYIWRGALNPADINAFWPSYSSMILRYAKLAQTDGVELFGIGSEYQRLQRYTRLWRQLAASVRSVYSGKLTYMAVTQDLAHVRFWDAVDYIGNSPYYQLSTAAVPTYSQLLQAWRPRLRLVHAVSLTYHRPVLFNEIGYLSAQYATAAPWSGTPAGAASQTLQANAYAALLDSAAKAPWLKGIVFYGWSSTSVPTDKTWSPRDKRAECEMARRWSSPTSPRLVDGLPVGCLGGDLAATAGLH